MKKSLLSLFFFVTMFTVSAQLMPESMVPAHYDAMPGDDMLATRIIRVEPVGASSADVWALVELQQTLSPQAKDNGPTSVTKLDLAIGSLEGVGGTNSFFYIPSLTYYHPGDAPAGKKSYGSSAYGKPLVWCLGTKNGANVTVNTNITFYTHISYAYKKGFLGLQRGFGTYIVEIPTQLILTQKWD